MKILIGLAFFIGVFATPVSLFAISVEQAEVKLLLASVRVKSLASRIEAFSSDFFTRPYLKFPLGEGDNARFDQNPRFRFDGFDCTTFIETVLALSLSRNFNEFESFMDKIRYENGDVAFENRNHFTDLDWIPNNVRAGIIQDITANLFPKNIKVARATIDKMSWYKMLSLERFHNKEVAPESLIEDLHSLGKGFEPTEAQITYTPIEVLVIQPELLEQIPSGSIINFVRANWNLKKLIGTNMNVSHQGFAIRKKNGELYFRHASSELKLVTEEPFLNYLQKMVLVKSISGINILKLRNSSSSK